MQITVTLESSIVEKALENAKKANEAVAKLSSGWEDEVTASANELRKRVPELEAFVQHIIITYNNAHPTEG